MNNSLKTRNRHIHLYNPREEGLGLYDVHYINAYKKNNKIKNLEAKNNKQRYAA